MKPWYSLGIGVLLLITSSNLFGQATAASVLQGTVIDRTEAAIPNADVTITNQATGAARTMKTSATALEAKPPQTRPTPT